VCFARECEGARVVVRSGAFDCSEGPVSLRGSPSAGWLRFLSGPIQACCSRPAIRFAVAAAFSREQERSREIRRMLSVNSTIGISLHSRSLMKVFRIIDPDGKYRAAINGRGH
jgi:hypothetical protein